MKWCQLLVGLRRITQNGFAFPNEPTYAFPCFGLPYGDATDRPIRRIAAQSRKANSMGKLQVLCVLVYH